MSEHVSYELKEQIATIAMDDGKVNAFSIEMLSALHAALDRAEGDDAVVVLTGRDGCLTAGFDLKVFADGDEEKILRMLQLGATLAERIMGFQTPVLIASPGHAVAAGAFMLLAADVRIGTDGVFGPVSTRFRSASRCRSSWSSSHDCACTPGTFPAQSSTPRCTRRPKRSPSATTTRSFPPPRCASAVWLRRHGSRSLTPRRTERPSGECARGGLPLSGRRSSKSSPQRGSRARALPLSGGGPTDLPRRARRPRRSRLE